jgi:hypothetical protein
MLLIKYFHVRQSKWLNCYASLVLSGLVLAWWSFRVFVVLDEEARHHQVKFAFELFAKKNCFRAFRSFCLCSFFTRMMLWRLFTAPLSLSLCNATMTSAFKNLPALLHHIEVWLSAYWEFHSMRCDLGAWKWSGTTVAANLREAKFPWESPFLAQHFLSEIRDTKQPFIPVINHHGREESLDKNSELGRHFGPLPKLWPKVALITSTQ